MEKFKLPIALSLVGIVLIIGGIFASGLNKSEPRQFPKESLIQSQKSISVDVSGAVNNPGVYQVEEGKRIEDAINSAGGFSKTANGEYISKYLNLAQKLTDGTKIYIPFVGEQSNIQAGPAVAGISTDKVNINTASQQELESVNWIGHATASKIISERPYQVVEDLLSKKVLGKAVFEKIKDSLVVY